ncbi:hypothetical protein HK098_003609 [Nowakowskiella sp. JEL0407]|nr:hypothetical protein HK098_003609 [Nowakowskiella sp. JEL0407]
MLRRFDWFESFCDPRIYALTLACAAIDRLWRYKLTGETGSRTPFDADAIEKIELQVEALSQMEFSVTGRTPSPDTRYNATDENKGKSKGLLEVESDRRNGSLLWESQVEVDSRDGNRKLVDVEKTKDDDSSDGEETSEEGEHGMTTVQSNGSFSSSISKNEKRRAGSGMK